MPLKSDTIKSNRLEASDKEALTEFFKQLSLLPKGPGSITVHCCDQKVHAVEINFKY
jgi:hypothetical protein